MADLNNINRAADVAMFRNIRNLTKSTQRLTSGLKNPTAADSMGMNAVANRLQQVLKGNEILQSSVANGKGITEIQDVVMQNLVDTLTRLSTVASTALDSTKTADDLAAINTECTQLITEFNTIATTVKYNGIDVFGATAIDMKYGIGANEKLDIGNISLTAASIAGTYNVTDNSSAQQLLDAINGATGFNVTLQGIYAKIAANMRKLTAIEDGEAVKTASYANALSSIRDIDVAKEAASFAKNQVQLMMGQSIIQQNIGLTQSALKFFN